MLHSERMKIIFEENDIDSKILGMIHIYGFCDELRRYAEQEEGFANPEKSRHRGAVKGKKAETA